MCDALQHYLLHVLGVALAGTRRWSDLNAAVGRVREAARESLAAGDSAAAKGREAVADVMEGIGAWRRGEPDRARGLLVRHVNRSGNTGGRARMALAELEASQGRRDLAIRYAQGELHGFSRPRALYIQARGYEARGDAVRAAASWRHFVTVTRLADAALPEVREGREARARLGG